MSIWFAADFHFGHENVIKYSKRPFDNVDDMDECLISLWCQKVQRGDTVYFIGDFSFHNAGRTSSILSRLPGNKILIKGNHDHSKQLKKTHGWAMVRDYYELKHQQETIVLSHYAFEVWNKHHHGSYHLHGHSHGSLPPKGARMDVGVDCPWIGWDEGMISFDRVCTMLKNRRPHIVDHHNRKRRRDESE